jgi:hypothetical protein
MRSVDWFDPKRFAKKKSLFGIMTNVLSQDNLQHQANCVGDKGVTLIVGYASVCRTMVSSVKYIPKKANDVHRLLETAQKEGRDSFSFVDVKGMESLIMWDPFPLVALCRVHMSRGQLLQLAHRLEGAPAYSFDPIQIERLAPPQNLKLSTPATEVIEEDSDDDSATDDFTVTNDQLIGTELEGLTVDTTWSEVGGIMSKGAIHPTVEKDLEAKMQFLNTDSHPFVGLRLLRSLLASDDVDTPLLHLLMAAELSQHDREKASAGESLNRYLDAIRRAKSTERLHPLTLIVEARLAHDKRQSLQLLRLFLTLFPKQNQLLTEVELDKLDDDDDTSSEVSESSEVIDPLLQKWIELKDSYPGEAVSGAMEELLKLTG